MSARLPAAECLSPMLREECGGAFHQNLLAARLARQGQVAHVRDTPAEIGAALLPAWDWLGAIYQDREHPLWHEDHPEHAEAVQAFRGLYEMLYGKAR